ncbi:MAG: glycosyltransferase, partial [candidate division WOR-3 bacterium]|nr:glycosyltransferase [candidate division WOR-3 bacterium]
YNVFYFEIPPASVLQVVKENVFRKRGIIDFLRAPCKKINNLYLFSFPPIFPASRYQNGMLRLFNNKRMIYHLKHKFYPLVKQKSKIVCLATTPYWYPIIKNIGFSFLVYDCIDDLKVFCKEKHLNYFSVLQKKLINISDLVIVSAEALKEDIKKINSTVPIYLISNGVPTNFYKPDLPVPKELQSLPRPIIGFIGALFEWVDTKLIENSARKLSYCSFVLIGPKQNIEIAEINNIYYLGPKPYNEIPYYINAFDVCIIPFVAGEVSKKVDPIKVYEYLAYGKPVVAINLPELQRLSEIVYLANTQEEFISMIKIALSETQSELKRKRMFFAQNNTWEIRTQMLINTINKHIRLKHENRH